MDERNKAAIKALLVTLLWSSSWIFIKFGLKDIPPLYFASLRYMIAGVLLLVFSLIHPSTRSDYNKLTKKWWVNLLIYGLLFITLTQGLQFVSLKIFPAITLSFVLNFTSIIVILIILIYEFFLILLKMLSGEEPREEIVKKYNVLLEAYKQLREELEIIR